MASPFTLAATRRDQFANGGGGWVVEISPRVSGCARPVDKLAATLRTQVYIAYLLRRDVLGRLRSPTRAAMSVPDSDRLPHTCRAESALLFGGS